MKEERLARLVASRFPARGASLLEVGCGEGSNLHFLRRALPGVSLTGLDFSAEKLAFLRAELREVETVTGDATELPFPDGGFDLVLCRDLLHHVPFARERVVAEAIRVARSGGTVVFIESDGRRFLNRIFMALLPAERGLRQSRPELLLGLAGGLGEPRLEYVEASFLVRACAFVLGWPEGKGARLLASSCYRVARLWERAVEAWVPRSRWSYMMMTLRKG